MRRRSRGRRGRAGATAPEQGRRRRRTALSRGGATREASMGIRLAAGFAGTIIVAAAAALAASPIGSNSYNMTTKVDLNGLTRDNFLSVVEPVAKTETGKDIVFYDFADTLCELMASK